MRVNSVCTASPSLGKWSSPPTTGPRPPPCSGFTFTAANQHLAVMFGGVHPEHGRINDVYIIDFNTMVRCECTCNNVYTVYKLALFEIGHIPMAIGTLQK